jgi:protein TonB
MAPQTIKDNAPNTLPADFAEWEEQGPPATLPDDFDEFDSTPTPPVKPASVQAAPAPAVTRMPEKNPVRKAQVAYTEAPAIPAPKYKPQRASVQPVQPVQPERSERQEKTESKSPVKWIAIGAVLLVLVGAGIAIPLKFMKPASPTAPVKPQVVSVQPTVTVTDSTSTTATPAKPTPSTLLQQQQQQQQQQAAATPAPQQRSVDSASMTNQLSAPSRISQILKSPQQDSSPPPTFSASGMEGLGGSAASPVGSVLGSAAHPKVAVATPKIVSISSGVAQGMLLQRTNPVYPSIAISARVSGTVVLKATISKTGVIEGLHVLSGPEMLRQAAMNAVRSWRYRPYMLDNEPVEVETTVSVIFSLGR